MRHEELRDRLSALGWRISAMPPAMAWARMSASGAWLWICARMASSTTSSSNTPVRPA